MTKAELVTAVQKGCDCGCDLSKKAVERIIDCAFESIAMAVFFKVMALVLNAQQLVKFVLILL